MSIDGVIASTIYQNITELGGLVGSGVDRAGSARHQGESGV